MAVTLVLAGAQAERLEVGISPLAELTAHLHVLADPSHHRPPASDSFPEPTLAVAIRQFSSLWSGYRARFLYPGAAGVGRSFEEELALVASYPLEAFRESALWAVRGGYTGCPPLGGPTVDPKSVGEVLARAGARSREAAQLATRLFEEPESVRRELLALLGRCHNAFFAAEWEQLYQRLEADAQARAALAQRGGVAAALASLSRAATVLSDPIRVRIEKVHHGRVDLAEQRLLIVPTLAGWPHLLVKHEPGWPPLVQYPVHEFAQRAEISTMADVQGRLAALVDPTRLRLCRMVAQAPATTTDLAARTDMSPPQVSRHLRVLREARLVERVRVGRLVRYQLRVDEVGRLGIDVLSALLR